MTDLAPQAVEANDLIKVKVSRPMRGNCKKGQACQVWFGIKTHSEIRIYNVQCRQTGRQTDGLTGSGRWVTVQAGRLRYMVDVSCITLFVY